MHTYDSLMRKSPRDQDEIVLNMVRPPRMPSKLADALEGMEIL